MREFLEQKRGITLIALVITIIVLLVLAGVSIASLTGDNGVLTKASDSKILNAIGEAKDEINLKATEGISEYYESIYLNGTSTSTHSITELAKMVMTKIANAFTKGDKTGIPNDEYRDYTIAIKGEGIDATITIQSKAVSTLKAVGTMQDDGKIVWSDAFKRSAQGGGNSVPSGGINWEQIMQTATKHPDQTGSDDIGLDALGNVINLDLWGYGKNFSNELCLLDPDGSNGDLTCCYIPLNDGTNYPGVELNNIVCPQYIKLAGSNTFLEMKDMWGGFSGTNLVSIVLPSTITTIKGFNDCGNLTNISIPNSVTTINNDAFKNCTSLTSINIPNSVTSIGSDAFEYCSALKKVYVDSTTILNRLKNGNDIFGSQVEEIYIKENIYDNTLTSFTIADINYAFNSIENGYAKYWIYGSASDPSASASASEP